MANQTTLAMMIPAATKPGTYPQLDEQLAVPARYIPSRNDAVEVALIAQPRVVIL